MRAPKSLQCQFPSQCSKGKGEKGNSYHPSFPKGRQSLISAPSCYKTCNLCRWESNPPRPVHTHTHTRTHARTRSTQLPTTAGPTCPATTTTTSQAPMPDPHARPHELRRGVVFSFFFFSRSRPFRCPRRDAHAHRGWEARERDRHLRGGFGGAWPTEPYFPKQISEGCHPTEACSRPTVSSAIDVGMC